MAKLLGRIIMEKMVKILVSLTPDQKAWVKAQRGGMAAFIRNLIDADMRAEDPHVVRTIVERAANDRNN